MIVPGQVLREHPPLAPMCEREVFAGLTFGVGPAGYDVRIAEDLWMWPGRFALASTIEYFQMPDDLLAVVHDKSTWARCGLFVQNTVIEPGWTGHLTLELTKKGLLRRPFLHLRSGMAIAQVIFHRLEEPAARPYRGKYQDQEPGPQEARWQTAG